MYLSRAQCQKARDGSIVNDLKLALLLAIEDKEVN